MSFINKDLLEYCDVVLEVPRPVAKPRRRNMAKSTSPAKTRTFPRNENFAREKRTTLANMPSVPPRGRAEENFAREHGKFAREMGEG